MYVSSSWLGNRTERLTDYNEECDSGEEGTPLNVAHCVLDCEDRSWGTSEKDQLDIVDNQWNESQQHGGSGGQALEDDKG